MPARLQTHNWKQCVALGRRGPAATTGSGRSSEPWCSCSLSDSPFTPVSSGHVGQKCDRLCWWANFTPSQQLSVRDGAEEVLPMAVFCFEASEL